jgi:hypothetical protein
MILKGFKTCLSCHSTCLIFLFSWSHNISICTQGKPQQKKSKKMIESDSNLGFLKLYKLVLHIQCCTYKPSHCKCLQWVDDFYKSSCNVTTTFDVRDA